MPFADFKLFCLKIIDTKNYGLLTMEKEKRLSFASLYRLDFYVEMASEASTFAFEILKKKLWNHRPWLQDVFFFLSFFLSFLKEKYDKNDADEKKKKMCSGF